LTARACGLVAAPPAPIGYNFVDTRIRVLLAALGASPVGGGVMRREDGAPAAIPLGRKGAFPAAGGQ
jgi:hypothetical protein